MFYLLETSASGNVWRLEYEFKTLPELKAKLEDCASLSSKYRILSGSEIGLSITQNIEVEIET